MALRVRGKDLLALSTLVLAVAWGTWLFVRMRFDLGGSWTDGEVHYEALAGERIRYAVWDAPELFGDLKGEPAGRPALSPDGRFLVFASGERGLNADLFVAELRGGRPVEPRPLTGVNSAHDELAPAFGPDALYFASDRSGERFGLDLWRVPYGDGAFGVPEPVGGGVNTAADETDPYPVPGTLDLLFASNRPRGARTDYELYRTGPAPSAEATEVAPGAPMGPGATEAAAHPLDALNTPFDEREPALTADGRTVIFASDRGGAATSFDLYRSFLEEGVWLPPTELHGVNTPATERGPVLSADGFSLFFESSREAEPPAVLLARSLELFRVPGPPLSLAEILTLVALLLLALLAWLSKYWRAIDVLYKCLLVSLLLHLLAMWYLREVYPESEPVTLPGEERVFRVRLAPSPTGTPSESRQRDGRLELQARRIETPEAAPSRAESEPELAAAAPSRAELSAPERELQAPARSDAELVENRPRPALEPALEERETPFEKLAGEAPGLAVQSPATAAAPTSTEARTPNRAATEAVTIAAAPAAVRLEAERDADQATGEVPGPTRRERVAAERTASAELAQPQESFQGTRAEAPAVTLPDVTVFAAPERRTGQASRRSVQTEGETDRDSVALPSPSAVPAPAEDRFQQLASGPRAPALETSVARGDPAVDLRDRHRAPASDAPARESARFDATSELARVESARPSTETGAPDRFESSPARDLDRDASPTPRVSGGGPPVRHPEQTDVAPRGRLEEPVDPDAGRPAVAVREVEEELAGSEASSLPTPRRFDPAADLARAEPRRFRPEDRARPTPARLERESRVPRARPERATLATVAPPPEPEAEPDDRPRRLEHTPYKNRFGEEKLRALEEFGGGVETERAVAQGLAYLASIQDARGNWGERRDYHDKYGDVRVGKTGLALLAFLGAGHTPGSRTEYEDVVERAIDFLLDVQHEHSGHFGDGSAYSHGIATYALAECYALTKLERLRTPLVRGVDQILANQDRRSDPRLFGGWGYYYTDDRVWNGDEWPRTSVTAWQVMALESARLGGLEAPGRAFEDARTFLVQTWDTRRAAFRYSHDPNRLSSGYPILPASTPAALFALSLLGVDLSAPELAPARRFVLERAPRDYRYTSDDAFVADARGNLYFWYYGTLAMFRAGGPSWERWNAAMKETLLEGQEPDGSWEPISVYCGYAGDDDRERAYATAINVLTLEVYYRYFTPLLEVR